MIQIPRRVDASFLVAGAALAVSCAGSSPPALTLLPCDPPGVGERAYCGVHEVWEDRSARSGRRIPLRVMLLPAHNPGSAPDPIVVLQGGPGASNVAAAGLLAGSPLRADRNILMVDVRGTGGSAALDCGFQAGYGSTGYLEDFLPIAGVRACRDSLTAQADLTQYVTPHVVDDLAEVLDALDLEQVNLHGFSGGTRQALAFIRRHPERVRTALLEGPVPLDARIPLTFARDAEDALDGVLAECLRDAACGRAFPAIRQEFLSVLQRVDSAPVPITVGRQNETVRISLSRPAFAQIIRYMLYRPATAAALPLAVHRAARGDFARLGGAAVSVGVGGGISIGFYLSNTCSEDLPWFTDAEASSAAAGTFLGTYRLQQQRDACSVWPRAELPTGYLGPVRSPVPVLILVGERDPVTPPRWGHEVAKHLANTQVIVVPGGGHAFAGLEPGECLPAIRKQFLAEASIAGLPLECVAHLRRPPFLLPDEAR
jgi:pimeloyl-ACP methyl ester carboxylesterase